MSMSAVTVLESYDTQMFDYPSDIDVPMHSSGLSDSWFHGEVAMEDDPQNLDQKVLLAGTTVEVDMEDFVGESVEYEMTDEAQIHQGGDELLDVEVYDASQAHTPTPTYDATYIPDTAQPHLSTTFASPIMAPDNQDPGHLIRDAPQDEAIVTHHSSIIEEPAFASPPIDLHGEIPTDIAVSADVVNDLVSSHSEEQPVPSDAVEAVREPSEPIQIPDGLTSHDPELGNDPGVPNAGPSLQWPEASEMPSDHLELPNQEHPTESIGFGEYQQEPQQEGNQGDSGTLTDPHEISEGVYIDPPPAVLLSVPSSGDSDIYLFNLPIPKSGASSPTAAEIQSEQQVQTLLLHQQPTLYYEPLTSVFEALRQEEYITRNPDFVEGELTIDAYDLHLVISEDNVYAREVTLHDLNVLHDDFHLSGPLRLHLQPIVPRFIYRYHSLRDQATRLNIVAEAEVDSEEHLDQGKHENNEEPRPLSEHTEAEEGGSEEQNTPLPSDSRKTLNIELAANNEEVTGEISHFPTELETQEVQEEVTQLLDDHTDPHVRSSLATEAEDSEADAPHEVPDSAEGNVEDVEDTGHHGDGNGAFEEEPVYHEHTTRSDEPEPAPEAFEEAEETLLTEEPELYNVPRGEFPYGDDADKVSDDDDNDSGHVEEPAADNDTLEYQDDTSTVVPSRQTDLEEQSVVDESDSNIVIHQAEIADPLLDPSSSTEPMQPPEVLEGFDEEWDDTLDGEGEPDPNWDVEHETESNESSVTLSSKASSKRTYDEVEYDAVRDDDDVSSLHSPEPKRTRVQ